MPAGAKWFVVEGIWPAEVSSSVNGRNSRNETVLEASRGPEVPIFWVKDRG